MSVELEARLDRWLEDMEEGEPLKLFVVGGIAVIIFLLVLGAVTSREFAYFAIHVMVLMGLLEDVVIPVVVIDVVRHCIASALISYIMLLYLVDLETAWLHTQRMNEEEMTELCARTLRRSLERSMLLSSKEMIDRV